MIKIDIPLIINGKEYITQKVIEKEYNDREIIMHFANPSEIDMATAFSSASSLNRVRKIKIEEIFLVLGEVAKSYLVDKEKRYLMANITGSPLSYINASLENLREWMCNARSFYETVFPVKNSIIQPKGITTIFLAGDEPALAGYISSQALLARVPIILRPSTLEAISAKEYVLELSKYMPFSIQFTPWPSDNISLTRYALDASKCAVLIGSDSTVENICKINDQKGNTNCDYRALKNIIAMSTGNSATIILNDSDIEKAARETVYAASLNKGSECINTKKVYIQDDVYLEVRDLIIKIAKTIRYGNPLDEMNIIGRVGIENVNMIKKAANIDSPFGLKEAEVLYHSFSHDSMGLLVLEDPSNSSTFVRGEYPGPTLALINVKDINDAVYKANEAVKDTISMKSTVTSIYGNNIEELISMVCNLQTHKIMWNRPTTASMDGLMAPHHGIYVMEKLVDKVHLKNY